MPLIRTVETSAEREETKVWGNRTRDVNISKEPGKITRIKAISSKPEQEAEVEAFGPIIQISLRMLSLKTALHLDLTSTKRVSDLCTSVSPSSGQEHSIFTVKSLIHTWVLTNSFWLWIISIEARPHTSQKRDRENVSLPVPGALFISIHFANHMASVCPVLKVLHLITSGVFAQKTTTRL